MSDIVFISVFNEGCIELAKNHLESLKRAGITNYVAYVTDQESYNKLINNYNVVYLSNSQITNDKKDFNSEDFNKLSYLRYYVIQKYLEANQPVWYLDVDTVVLKNLNKKYVELLETYKNYHLDGLFQSDINSICTGCMCLFPTENIKQLVNTIIKEKLGNANDQMLLNYLVNEKKHPLSFALLECTEFPIGYLYFNNQYVVPVDSSLSKVIEKKNEYESIPNKDTHFVHANWIIGNENKIKSLKEYNLWFV
jgi:lipopolysaccharide biosynthesis glycosyltransferase